MKGKAEGFIVEGFITLIYLGYQQKTFLSWVGVRVALTFNICVIVWFSNQTLYYGAEHVCMLYPPRMEYCIKVLDNNRTVSLIFS